MEHPDNMEEGDILLQEGLKHYAEAMHAIRYFEHVVDETALALVERRMPDLLEVFAEEKLGGGGTLLSVPDISGAMELVPQDWWSWIGRQYWIGTRGGCNFFVGLYLAEGKFIPAVIFSPQRAPLREWLFGVLNRAVPGTAVRGWEYDIMIQEELSNQPTLQDLSDAMERALNKVIEALRLVGGWAEGT